MANLHFDTAYTKDQYHQQIRSDFTRRAPAYNAGKNGAMHVDLIRSLLHFHPPVYPVLDIACGTGLLATELGPDADRVTGIDLTPAMLAEARLASPNASFVEGRAENLPFPDATFASAYTCAALVYFTDVHAALREAYRVLKDGGFLAYQAVTLDSYVAGVALEKALADILGEERASKIFKLPHGITDTYEANLKLMESAGFANVTMEKVTVLSDLTVEDMETWWDRWQSNAMTKRVGLLPPEDAVEVRNRYIQLLESRRREDNTIQETVTSWYVRGTKLPSS